MSARCRSVCALRLPLGAIFAVAAAALPHRAGPLRGCVLPHALPGARPAGSVVRAGRLLPDMRGGDGGNRTRSAGLFPAVTVAVSAFLWGYETGIITAALLSIVPEFELDVQPGALGLVATTATIGSLCGTLAAGRSAEYLGRRKMVQIAACCSLLGCVLASNAARLDVLILARLLAGFSIGVFATVLPMYAAECATKEARGMVMSLPQLGMSSGIASAYLVSIFVLVGGGGHTHMFASVGVSGMLCLLVASASPESPRWLLRSGNRGGATRALARLRGLHAGAWQIEHELQQVESGIRDEEKVLESSAAPPGWRSLGERTVLRTLGLCLLLQIFQQLSGINAVINFAPAILKEAGVAGIFNGFSRGNDRASVMMATFAVYSPKLVMISLVVPLMDLLGRRCVLLTLLPVLAASLFSLALALDPEVPSVGPTTALLALLVYQSVFSCSLGPIPSMLSAELLPNHARAAGMSVLLTICTLCNVAVSSSWPLLQAAMGSSRILGMYAAMTGLAFVFSYLYVPETRGLALEESRV